MRWQKCCVSPTKLKDKLWRLRLLHFPFIFPWESGRKTCWFRFENQQRLKMTVERKGRRYDFVSALRISNMRGAFGNVRAWIVENSRGNLLCGKCSELKYFWGFEKFYARTQRKEIFRSFVELLTQNNFFIISMRIDENYFLNDFNSNSFVNCLIKKLLYLIS